jgi:23S rRNA (cytidine2498-2'-O)-methyltransferase
MARRPRQGRHSQKERPWYGPKGPRPDAAVKVETPPRVRPPPLPKETMIPNPGRWLWTCRAGFEGHLFEELAWAKSSPRLLGAGLVESSGAPKGPAPAFGRMGFVVDAVVRTPAEAAKALGREPLVLQCWAADTDEGNALSGEVDAWTSTLSSLRASSGVKDPETPWKAHEQGAWLGQVCVLGRGAAAVGRVRAREAVSLSAGGKSRQKRTEGAPSRAAMKLDEALDWYGLAPGKGEVCVDLGSAPGGWTRRLVERGARVWSVDPGHLAPDLEGHPKVKHFLQSAFDFEPPERVDWVFCDMAWRPLEVAQLLAKWGRKKWATQLVANVKLLMGDKAAMIWRVRATLESGNWAQVRVRQLYHDRDEVTVSARRAA